MIGTYKLGCVQGTTILVQAKSELGTTIEMELFPCGFSGPACHEEQEYLG